MATAQRLNPTLSTFIEKQPLFFVATAAENGRVNMSPKGMHPLKIMAPDRIVWLNLSGSGNETAAHIAKVNRMTLMFCAFEGSAMILRCYGTATALHPRDDKFEALSGLFEPMAGSRQIFDMHIDLVQTSCGTGVPLMAYEGQRGPDELLPYFADMGEDGLQDYWKRKNAVSLDGLDTGLIAPE
ncbi:MAG: pyridoxamine 5'-phosphate oxidase family protein [Pseudomonadota bacterium]